MLRSIKANTQTQAVVSVAFDVVNPPINKAAEIESRI